MEKLKPCPLCGTEFLAINRYSNGDVRSVECDMCDVSADTVAAWNNRPIEDAQAAKIAQLEKALELACDDMCRSMRCSDCIAEPACQEDTYPLTDHYMQKAKEATK